MERAEGKWYRILRAPWGMVLGFCIFWMGLQASSLGPLTPILITQLGGLDKAQVVLFFVVNILTGIVVNLTAGYLSDGKVPRPLLILVAGLVSTAGNAGLAAGGPAEMLYVYGALTSTGLVLFSQFFALGQAEVMKHWSKQDKVLGTTVLRTAFSLGFIIGTGLAAILLLWIDLRSLFWFLAASGALFAVFSAAVTAWVEASGRAIGSQPSEAEHHASRQSQLAVIPWGALIVPIAALALMQGADRARMIYMPLVVVQSFHDARWAPLLFGITAAMELGTMVLVGSLAVRFGEKRTIVAGDFLGSACFAAMAVFPTLAVLFLANVAYSFFIAMLMGVAMAFVQGLLAHRPGMGGSLYVLTMNLGSLVGTLAPIVITGYSSTTFLLPAGLCLLGALLMFGTKPQK